MTRVYTLLKEGFEEIEALTVVDFLRRADIEIFTVSTEKDLMVEGSHKIKVMADMMFSDLDLEDIDLLFIPGGMPAAKDLADDPRVADLVQKLDKRGRVLAAICAGPMVLAKGGALKGKEATSYPGFDKFLEGIKEYKEDVLLVRDENVITSRSVSTANYLALALIELIKGTEKMKEIKAEVLLDKVEDLRS